MNFFLKKLFIFISFFVITFLSIILIWIIYNYPNVDNPAPNFSTSYSLNEKMLFLKKNKTSIKPEVLSIGSSMSLNNLHSETIVEYLKTKNYLNSSSWGLNIKENYHMLKILVEIYKPKTVISAINLMDFQKSSKTIRYDLIKQYLQSDYSFPYYFEAFNMPYYFQNIKYSNEVRTHENEYEYLGYDKYGAVNYKKANFQIVPERWNGEKILNYKIELAQYQYLDSISLFCEMNGIELYFFHGSFREGYLSNLNQKEQDLIFSHIERIKAILNDNKCNFISAIDTTWKDSLFVDWTHLNSKGAKYFTEYCLKKRKKQIMEQKMQLSLIN